MFNRIVNELHGMVLGMAYARLRDYHLAQDVAQMTFVTAFDKLDTLQEPRAFVSWLQRITVSQCNRLTRRCSYSETCLETLPELPSPEPNPRRAAEHSDLLGHLRTEVDQLPDHQRVVVDRFYAGGQSTTRIAEALGLPTTTVKKRLHDARCVLRRRLRKLETETNNKSHLPCLEPAEPWSHHAPRRPS